MSDVIPPTLAWKRGHIRVIDQRLLPGQLVFLDLATVDELCEAITTLAVRGAPALGVAGAMGIGLAALNGEPLEAAAARLLATRPTAVNLAWGVARALAADRQERGTVAAQAHVALDVLDSQALGLGHRVLGGRVYTHCNAGSLACVGYGTALGVIRAAHEAGREPSVWVGETRPALQGARLTAWELSRLRIPATLVTDSMAGPLMASFEVDCVVVGADRIAANGDVANKIGTYGLAVLAHHHRVPFYVAAPLSTVDFDCHDGTRIPIERRAREEVTSLGGVTTAPEGVEVDNRAFDVTPADLVSAIITEEGLARPPYSTSLADLAEAAGYLSDHD